MENIQNLWKEIDDAVEAGIIDKSDIKYDKFFSVKKKECIDKPFIDCIKEEFLNLWSYKYIKNIGQSNQILEFNDGFYECLFDAEYERVVAFFGFSNPTDEVRDTNRQAGFIPEFTKHYKGKDRGHFLSHRQGGGMDVNFFPQKKEVNRGWNEAGKIYRKMERFCSANPGIFCFSRPLYNSDNNTWDPDKLEYGIIIEKQFRIVVFPN